MCTIKKLIYFGRVSSFNSLEGKGVLVATLFAISLVLAAATPFDTLALKAHFSPIIPYFMPTQNTSGPAAALQGPGPAAALQGPVPANATSKTSNQTGTGGFLSKGTINSPISYSALRHFLSLITEWPRLADTQ